MPLSIRTFAVLCLASILFALLFAQSSAEPPESGNPEGQLSERGTSEGQISHSDDRETGPFRTLRDAVEGSFSPEGTGDGVLDDMIEVIKQRGSIVDRFPKDPTVVRGAEVPAGVTDGEFAARQVIAAEQLLRAARLLEKVPRLDPQQVALVRQMRSQAGRLLSE